MSWIQWPAAAASVIAAWLVASTSDRKRKWGFWVFLVSNVLWVLWGVSAKAYAVIALQICLAAMNIRGVKKTEEETA
jgi:bacteriorhodopsin